MTPAGLEPAIPGSVGRCLIHWATGPAFLNFLTKVIGADDCPMNNWLGALIKWVALTNEFDGIWEHLGQHPFLSPAREPGPEHSAVHTILLGGLVGSLGAEVTTRP